MSKELLIEVAEKIFIEALKLEKHKHPSSKIIRKELDKMLDMNECGERIEREVSEVESEPITEIAERMIDELIKLDEMKHPSCGVIRRTANEIMFSNRLSEKQISEHKRIIRLREAVVTFQESAL